MADKSVSILSTRELAALLHQHKQLTLEITKKQKLLEELAAKINNSISNFEKHYYGSSKKSETQQVSRSSDSLRL